MKQVTWGTAIIAALVAAPVAQAQTVVRLGPVVGLNLSTLSASDPSEDIEVDSRLGPLFGGFVSFDLSPSFSIQPELLYTRRGADLPIEDITGSIKLDYIQIPLLARVRFPGSSVTPFLQAGPALAFKSSCKVGASAGGVSETVDCTDDDLDFVGLKSTSLSGIVGAGLDVGNFQVGLRYDHGFTNIIRDAGPGEKAANRAFSITVGYGFRLGSR